MSLAPSGTFSPVAPAARVPVSSATPVEPLPLRESGPTGEPVAELNSDPATSGASVRTINEITTVGPIGEGAGDTSSERDARAEDATKRSAESSGSEVATEEEKTANREATRSARRNVLRCISTRTPAGAKVPSDPNQSFEDCLEDILAPNFTAEGAPDIKAILCGLVTDTEDKLKDNIDRAGGQLITAAEKLINGQVAEDLLGKASSLLGQVDPGVIGNCLGAQELIQEAQDQLAKAQSDVAAAAAEAVAPVIETLEEKSQAAQDLVDFADNVTACQEDA